MQKNCDWTLNERSLRVRKGEFACQEIRSRWYTISCKYSLRIAYSGPKITCRKIMLFWGVSKNQKERMRPHLLSWCQFYPVCYDSPSGNTRTTGKKSRTCPSTFCPLQDGARPTSLFAVPLNLWILYLSFLQTLKSGLRNKQRIIKSL